jgi:hypothetical protein
MGTVFYMSPEQRAATRLTLEQTFGVSSSAYEMLTVVFHSPAKPGQSHSSSDSRKEAVLPNAPAGYSESFVRH